MLRATTLCTFSKSELPKVVRTLSVFNILSWKCASHHNGVHFFDISTPKSGPELVCFVHFDLEMCFAPQRRPFLDISTSKSGPHLVCFVHFHFEICFVPQRSPLFGHLNFQKWSAPGVFCTFSHGNVLRATTACTFWTSQLPKVVREWCVLYILTWKRASRHNGVHFLDISTAKSGPHLVCFVHFDLEVCFAPQRRAIFHLSSVPASSAPAALASLLFDPPEPQIIRKTQCFGTFLPFRPFFLLIFLFSLPLPCSAFHLSILSEV